MGQCCSLTGCFVIIMMMMVGVIVAVFLFDLPQQLPPTTHTGRFCWCHANLHSTFYIHPTQNEMR